MKRNRLGFRAVAMVWVAMGCGGSTASSGPTPPDTDGAKPDSSIDIDGGEADASDERTSEASTPDALTTDAVASDAVASDVNGSDQDSAADGDSGRALLFDGTSNVVNISIPAGADETAFTSEAWFRTTSPTGMLIEIFGSGADRSLYLTNGKVCFYVFKPDYSYACSPASTYADGVWHHVAGALGAGGQELYLDGTLVASVPETTRSAFVADSGVRLGYGYIGANGSLVYFKGVLDEVRLWRVKRTGAEIAANRSVQLDPATADLQGYWPLNENVTSTTAHDATSANHDGVLSGFAFSPSPWISPGAL